MTQLPIAAFLIGVVAGLRSLTAPAVVSWAVRLGWLHPDSSVLAFMGYAATPYVFSVLAIGELIGDQLPKTPSRKAPVGFMARIVTGGLSGSVFGATGPGLALGAVAGVLGAVVGTLGGYAGRVWLARAVGKDLPAALVEDAIAIGGALLLVQLS